MDTTPDTIPTLDKAARLGLARRYAEGELTIHELRRAGHGRMIELFADLAELGLRPPLCRHGRPERGQQAGRARTAGERAGAVRATEITDDLIITDTSPLITLALGDQLNALVAPGLRVVIPDAVWVEATRFDDAPGASELIDWVARNDSLVSMRPTEVGQDQLQRLRNGRSIRGMGEPAALEVLTTTAALHPWRHLFLIFEDKDLERRTAILPAKSYAITTGDWLRLVERIGLIQSADQALDRAAERGRVVDRLRSRGSRSEALEAAQASLVRAKKA